MYISYDNIIYKNMLRERHFKLKYYQNNMGQKKSRHNMINNDKKVTEIVINTKQNENKARSKLNKLITKYIQILQNKR